MSKRSAFVILGLVFFFVAPLAVPGFGQDYYTWVKTWGGTGQGDGQFDFQYSCHLGMPGGIAVDSQNNVYVLQKGNWESADYRPCVQKFSKDGEFILSWGSPGTGDGQFMWPTAIAIDQYDRVFVSDGHWDVVFPNAPRIQAFDAEGHFLFKYDRFDPPYPLMCPGGIDFDREGFLYVVDNHGVKKFDQSMNLVNAFGVSSPDDSDPYAFFYPSYLAINSRGDIYVSIWGEYSTGRYWPQIRKYDANFQYQARWHLAEVMGIAVDAEDNVLAVAGRNVDAGAYKYDANGTLLQRIAPNGQGDGEVWFPFAITVDSEGYVYIVDFLDRVQKFAPPLKYNLEGFFSPVDNQPTVNSAKAGQAIPIKWRLTDNSGLPVSDPNSFKSITSYGVSCAAFTGEPISEVVEEPATGNSGLQYLGDGWWQYNWKTPKTYAGQCRIMKLTLSDNSVYKANFSFK